MQPLRILFVTPYVPSRLRPRPFHLLQGLAERGHRIALVSAATSARELADVAELARCCERLQIIRISAPRALWNCARALAAGQPLQAAFCMAPAMSRALRHAMSSPLPYDVVHIEH